MSIASVSSVQPGEVGTEAAARALRRIKDFLAAHPDGPDDLAVMVEAGGEKLVIPHPILGMFAYILAQLADGRGVSVVPSAAELTTQQAANLLNVSRPYVIDLLESGQIPFRRVGRHRRILFQDLLAFKRRDDAHRREAADDLSMLSQELGLH